MPDQDKRQPFSIHLGRILNAGGHCCACGDRFAVQESAAVVLARASGQTLTLHPGCLRTLHDGLVAIVSLHPDWLPPVCSAAITESGRSVTLRIDGQGRLHG